MTALMGTLSECGNMHGTDPAGESVGRAYDKAGRSLVDAMVAARNGLVIPG